MHQQRGADSSRATPQDDAGFAGLEAAVLELTPVPGRAPKESDRHGFWGGRRLRPFPQGAEVSVSKSELLVAEQVEHTDFSSADICSAKPPAVPEAVKRHRKPPEGRVLQGFHEPPPKSVTVRKESDAVRPLGPEVARVELLGVPQDDSGRIARNNCPLQMMCREMVPSRKLGLGTR